MNKIQLSVLFLCGVFATVTSHSASDISELVITGCRCDDYVNDGNVVCTYRQMGEALHGSIREDWSWGSVSCSSTYITGWGNYIIGYDYVCNMDSRSGTFTVEYTGGREVCGRDYDTIDVNDCTARTACSQLGH